MVSTLQIQIKGLVQGVGFRPFVYRMAMENKIRGWVVNSNDGVIIQAQGEKADLEDFLQSIKHKAPRASKIMDIQVSEIEHEAFDKFEIIKSTDASDEITEVSPDIAVCDECLEDMKHQPHRINYPFINCTHCGPRFTIIQALPYDRERTTMRVFPMCETCRKEYENIMDRRFHAQPVACNNCGPHYTLHYKGGKTENLDKILEKISQIIQKGGLVAMKGLGGFHLACDALNEDSVKRLRELKLRESKPFAVMFRDISTVKDYALINKDEEQLLSSWQRPIVLLKMKKSLAPSVSNGMRYTGIMLPYMPFHYLLFEKLTTPAIVLTSGNFSDEPIIIDNEKAVTSFGPLCDAVLTYNRQIQNRTDDSVAIVVNHRRQLIRRSRGYAPSPVYVSFNADGIFAAGAELVNCFAIGKGNQVILSQHIGDLKNLETLEFYEEAYDRFCRLFRFKPHRIACDLHPDYLSSRFAETMGLSPVKVQHHHAHIASVLAEKNINRPVLGVAMDGTGLGTDGNIWGGEFLLCDLSDYQRLAHFEYIPIPGGDSAVKEPWKTAISYLYHYFGSSLFNYPLPFLNLIDREKIDLVIQSIDKKINCPLSGSAGRLFDAVSAMFNRCIHAGFHAEAPMRLEATAIDTDLPAYSIELTHHDEEQISFKGVFEKMIIDFMNGRPVPEITSRFHITFVHVILEKLLYLKKYTGVNSVVLSGGTFQNKIILTKLMKQLVQHQFEVFIPEEIPFNDGGIALGQLAVAAHKQM